MPRGSKPGERRGGRQKGTPNKITSAFKTAVLEAFHGLGGVAGLEAWGRENRTEFYRIAARLIPHEVVGVDGGPIRVIFGGRHKTP